MPTKNKLTSLQSGIAPQTIGFRLDEESRALLAKEAVRAGVSPHEVARISVVRALHNYDEKSALVDAINSLEAQVEAFAATNALAVEALLACAGKVSKQAAKEWVDENLRSR